MGGWSKRREERRWEEGQMWRRSEVRRSACSLHPLLVFTVQSLSYPRETTIFFLFLFLFFHCDRLSNFRTLKKVEAAPFPVFPQAQTEILQILGLFLHLDQHHLPSLVFFAHCCLSFFQFFNVNVQAAVHLKQCSVWFLQLGGFGLHYLCFLHHYIEICLQLPDFFLTHLLFFIRSLLSSSSGFTFSSHLQDFLRSFSLCTSSCLTSNSRIKFFLRSLNFSSSSWFSFLRAAIVAVMLLS